MMLGAGLFLWDGQVGFSPWSFLLVFFGGSFFNACLECFVGGEWGAGVRVGVSKCRTLVPPLYMVAFYIFLLFFPFR